MSSVLIVDDERPVTDAFATFFQRHGNHDVSCAYTGAEAIAAFEASRPDLVLLDLRLPDMTGFDVYARIRQHSPVVIMISGHGDVPLHGQRVRIHDPHGIRAAQSKDHACFRQGNLIALRAERKHRFLAIVIEADLS